MELVLAHRNMDFDCLACQLAVHKLFPAARIAPAHPISQRIRSFLALYRDKLPLVDLQYVDWNQVKHVYLVDCQRLDRLDDRARKLFVDYKQKGEYTVFDHHETDDQTLLGAAKKDSIVKITGAAASILVERLKEQKIRLSPFEATVIAAGIYEDTGCLTHRGTTELDALGVAYCLSQGADLERINDIIRPKFDEWQSSLYERLLNASETLELGGGRLTVCVAASDRYIDGLSEISSRLLESSAADALVSVVEMKDRIHVVARSETSLFDLRALAKVFGGGGHSGAISAVVKGPSLGETREKVIESLASTQNPQSVARDIMITPVRTIRPDISMEEAGRIMLRYAIDGLVVMENDDMVGIVSIRDVDKARHHKLAHARVKGFMSHPVISVNESTPLSEIQAIMMSKDIGRVPVLDDNDKLLGIIGRHELLNALYGEDPHNDFAAGIIAPKLSVTGAEHLTDQIEPNLLNLYKQLGAVAAELNMVAYLVGGCVRDLILKRANFDLDFVVEGSARTLARKLTEKYPEKYELVVEHERFDTATLYALGEQKREIDIATARTEYYEYPAALPTVEPSSLEHDLSRRDFTINALALCLAPDRFGEIVDYFNGISDVHSGTIRVLHPFSFIEDPTRIVRAARFAARLGFQIEARTKLQAERAIALGIFDNLGGVRLKEELRMILESNTRIQALDILHELGGGLSFLESTIKYSRRTRLRLIRAEKLLEAYELPKPFVVFLGVLVSELPEETLVQAIARLHLADDDRSCIIDAERLLRGLLALDHAAKRSELYRVLHGHDPHSLAICVCIAPMASQLRRSIRIYFEELKDVKTELRGNDLMALGVRQGPEIGRLLEQLRDARLDGEVISREDETQFIKNALIR